MGVEIRQVGECFAGEVTGIDLTEPLSTENVNAIHEGMDKYAVLTFREQPLTAEEQLAFSKQLGDIEHAVGTSLREDKDARLPSTFADVSNLDKEDRPFDINDRRRLFAIGNRLWHSDSSFKVVPAKYSILHAISTLDVLVSNNERTNAQQMQHFTGRTLAVVGPCSGQSWAWPQRHWGALGVQVHPKSQEKKQP